jgi:hypothetical protein
MPRKAAPAGDVSEARSLEGWRADAIELPLDADDLDLIDRVLCVVPELRIVAFLGQVARRRGLAYPVSTAKELVAILGDDSFELAGHRVDAESIQDLPQEWFPLAHEGELLSVIYLGLHRCQANHTAALLDGFRLGRHSAPNVREQSSEPKS